MSGAMPSEAEIPMKISSWFELSGFFIGFDQDLVSHTTTYRQARILYIDDQGAIAFVEDNLKLYPRIETHVSQALPQSSPTSDFQQADTLSWLRHREGHRHHVLSVVSTSISWASLFRKERL
jgi:hypothetical protein